MRAHPRSAFGLLLVIAGAVALLWTLVVWRSGDPFTGMYTALRQRELSDRYAELAGGWTTAGRSRDMVAAARRHRLRARPGDPIARLTIERLGLKMIVVEGADAESLKSGPGRDPRSSFAGEGKLVYIAGHRTTYRAPFAKIDRLRSGDRMTLETPYGRFVYAVRGHRIVAADDVSVLRSPDRELLRLQACHPRFFASHRYVVSAELVETAPPAPGARSSV